MAQPYIGEIRQFAGNFAPVGWLMCNGQLLPIDQYDVLFNLIGTTYGGDGQTNFALPDLQGRVPVHTGSGLPLSTKAGTETVTLIQNQLPLHTHTAAASNTGNSDSPAGNLWATATANAYGPTPSNATMNPGGISPAGGNQPHENRVPFVVLTYIIATEGVYPSPS